FRQEQLHRLLVADEIVVDEVDVPAIAELVAPVQLGQHLGFGLSARHAPVKLNDVAEFAGKWATARELNADVEVAIRLQQVEARDRALGYVGFEFLGLEHAPARSCLPGRDEFVNDAFGFAEHLEIRRAIGVRHEVTAGPPMATGLPLARQRSMTATMSLCCGSMPPVMTRSAQARSAVRVASMLRSPRRTVHVAGSSAATVIKPSGAVGYLAPISS